ncbi:MAG: hypothetical protein KDK39_14320 [Leptospiraceae bacterium]|nr:hypothetical protein [Leptospiraceae bacterium]
MAAVVKCDHWQPIAGLTTKMYLQSSKTSGTDAAAKHRRLISRMEITAPDLSLPTFFGFKESKVAGGLGRSPRKYRFSRYTAVGGTQ